MGLLIGGRNSKAGFAENGKDCDIGYAPTADSCEGVCDPDTCTVAVLDATTASAVSDPGRLSQG